MKIKNKKLNRFWKWYIKGEYHCDECPYCWGGQHLPGCDDYDDCGCYIKGDIAEGSCRLLPPIRFFLGWGNRKKAEYYANHQYDNMGDWYERDEKEQKEFERLLSEWLSGYELNMKYKDGTTYPADKDYLIKQESWRVRYGYDKFAHPVIHEKISKRWRNLIRDTWKAFIGIFKPYFCK